MTDHSRLPHSLGVCLLARFKVGAQSAPAYGRCCKAGESQVTLPGVGFLSLLPKFMEWIQDDSWSANGCRRLFVFCNPISQLKGILVLNVPCDHCLLLWIGMCTGRYNVKF